MMKEYTWTEYLASLPAARDEGHYPSSWTDNESFDTAMHKMANGDEAYAAMADKLLDQLQDLSEGMPVREWTASPIGAYPIVPEVLSGMPACMRILSPSGELTPVKVVISSTSSGAVSKETMTKRGVAVLALIQKLQVIRPVELYILVEGNDEHVRDDLFQMIRVDTKPLSVAHACFALANVGDRKSVV